MHLVTHTCTLHTLLDTLIHRKTASIEIDVQILTHLIAYKLNTCAPHWYREHFHAVLLLLCFVFGLAFGVFSFYFSNRWLLLFYFFAISPDVSFSVPLGFIARDAAHYIRHLHSLSLWYIRMCLCVLVFHVICFIRSCLAFIRSYKFHCTLILLWNARLAKNLFPNVQKSASTSDQSNENRIYWTDALTRTLAFSSGIHFNARAAKTVVEN